MAKTAKGSDYKLKEIPLNGKLMIGEDPAVIGVNFQQLENLRYTDGRLQSVDGMTKVNTSAIANIHLESLFQFQKEFVFDESHLLVAARDANDANQKIYRGTSNIGSQFNLSTLLYTSANAASTIEPFRFSSAPNGMMAACNGEETLLWPGLYHPISLFHNFDSNNVFKYDWTDQLINELTDADNIATLYNSDGGFDANTLLLLHMDNNLTDATGTHTAGGPGITFESSAKKFGTHSAIGSNYVSFTDHADFDLSGGTWTMDFWIDPNITLTAGPMTIYYQQTDSDNYFKIALIRDSNSTGHILLSIFSGAAEVLGTSGLSTPAHSIPTHTWSHVAVVEDSNNYYIFINGILKAQTSDTSRPANYTGVVLLFRDTAGSTNPYGGLLDEFRLSNVARWTDGFEVYTSAYDASDFCNIYVGHTLQLDKIYFYIQTANDTTNSINVYYWDGDTWTSVTNLADNTSSAGVSFAVDGSLAFDSTVGTAQMKIIDGVPLYLYKIEVVGGVTAGTQLKQVAVSAPMQTLKDIWDGDDRTIASFQVFKNNTYNDYTTNVFDDEFDSLNTATFVELDSLATGTNYIVCGFLERMQAIQINLIGGHVNTAAAIATVEYWNGSEWVELAVQDSTVASATGSSFAKSGILSWTSPAIASEHKTIIASKASSSEESVTGESKVALYYYKISFNASLSADVQAYYVSGIPAQQTTALKGFKFSMNHLGRLWLCNNQYLAKNMAMVSAVDTSQVFNGKDSFKQYFGDNTGILNAVSLFYKFGSAISNTALFLKRTETWALDGNDLDSLTPRLLSRDVGIVSPETLISADIMTSDNVVRRVAIWQSQNGIVMSDGTSIMSISDEIRGLFDRNNDSYLGDAIYDAQGFYDASNNCYHWVVNNATVKVEYVFDIKRKKWFRIIRSTNTKINGGLTVYNSNGVPFVYGFGDTGYIWQLENGSNFDGDQITAVFRFGDMALAEGSPYYLTTLKSTKLIAKTTGTSRTVTVTHYSDGKESGDAFNSPTTLKSGYRIINDVRANRGLQGVFHSLKYSVVIDNTEDSDYAFEPITTGVAFTIDGENI